MSKIRAYMSHPIRGKLGNKVTHRDITMNCSKAICIGTILEICISDLEMYIPAKHDEFVTKAYRKNYINEHQILDIDCDIIGERDLLIVYNWQNFLSNGMVTEINYAKEHSIPIYSFMELNERVLDELGDIVVDVRLQKELEDERSY